MVWKATGKGQLSNSKETFRDPDLGIMIKAFSRGTQVDATATGTVHGIGQSPVSDASNSATIEKHNDGTLIIQRTP
jgi:hypothetical protein